MSELNYQPFEQVTLKFWNTPVKTLILGEAQGYGPNVKLVLVPFSQEGNINNVFNQLPQSVLLQSKVTAFADCWFSKI